MGTRRRRRTSASPSLTTAHLWPIVIIVGIFAFLNTHPIRPHDFWWHMAAGREIATTGAIPTVDSTSSTAAGVPYPAYNVYWLAELTTYLVYTAGRAEAVILAHSCLVTAAYGLVMWLSYRLTRNWRIAALATLGAAALGINDWNVRPQAASFWLAPLYMLTINAYRENPRPGLLVIFPLGMALWVNCHGSFPLGIGLIGLWLVDSLWTWLKARHAGQAIAKTLVIGPLAALALGVLACIVNPQGIGVLTYVLDLSANPVVQTLVPEWAPPTFQSLDGGLFLVGLLAVAAILALSTRRPTAFQMLSFLTFGVLGLRTTRGAIWFGLVVAPTAAEHLTALWAAYSKRQQQLPAQTRLTGALNIALAALLLSGAIVTLPWFKPALPLPPAKAGLLSLETPVAATEALLERQPPGLLFSDMAFGSYLVWAAQPHYPVFVDPRIELYPPEVWYDYIRISSGACDWEALLADYDIHTLMLSPETQGQLLQAARTAPAWSEIYSDETAVILVRRMVP